MARLDPTGVSRILTYIKTWITGLLSNKSDSSHTHSDYVPRSGGAVMSGATKIKIAKSDNRGELRLDGGTDWGQGGSLCCHGKDDPTDTGTFILRASNSTNYCMLMGFPNGTLTWGNKEIDTIEEQGNNYIRYSSGLQICWGEYARTTETSSTINFPKAFNGHGSTQPISVSVNGQSSTVIAYGWTGEWVLIENTNTGSFTYTAVGRWK